MTSPEVRATVTAYYKIRELLDEPLPAETRDQFTAFLDQAELDLRAVTSTSAPAKWARSIVGPVLAAAAGSIRMDSQTISQVSVLRIFGLAGSHSLSNEGAWTLMRNYLRERVILPETITSLQRQTGLRLRLPDAPTPVDVLAELTRPRSGIFPSQVAYWLAEHFQTASQDSCYGELYRATLHNLTQVSDSGENAQIAGPHAGRMTREDWDAVLHGRMPQARIEQRAGYLVARQFIGDLYARRNARAAARLAT